MWQDNIHEHGARQWVLKHFIISVLELKMAKMLQYVGPVAWDCIFNKIRTLALLCMFFLIKWNCNCLLGIDSYVRYMQDRNQLIFSGGWKWFYLVILGKKRCNFLLYLLAYGNFGKTVTPRTEKKFIHINVIRDGC